MNPMNAAVWRAKRRSRRLVIHPVRGAAQSEALRADEPYEQVTPVISDTKHAVGKKNFVAEPGGQPAPPGPDGTPGGAAFAMEVGTLLTPAQGSQPRSQQAAACVQIHVTHVRCQIHSRPCKARKQRPTGLFPRSPPSRSAAPPCLELTSLTSSSQTRGLLFPLDTAGAFL